MISYEKLPLCFTVSYNEKQCENCNYFLLSAINLRLDERKILLSQHRT